MNELLLIVIFFISIINVFFIIIMKKNSLFKNETDNKKLKFSLIIAAKNEEENIPALIESLKQLNYPPNDFEVVIIDDNSSDRTFETVLEETKDLQNFHIYKIQGKEIPAKKGVLQFGTFKAKNPFILITDADCTVSPDWINSYDKRFNSGYDFLFGIAPFYQEKSLINKISCFENLRTSILTFSSAFAGFPYSASARNFGFSKAAFDKLSGYKNTTETLSGDDDLLLREAVKKKMKIGVILDDDCFVPSKTKKSFSQYFKQKTRHTKTSLYYLLRHKLLLGFWHVLNLALLFSIFLTIFNFNFIFFFSTKIFLDLIVVLSLQRTFKYRFSAIEIIHLQILYEIFIIINFFNALTKKEEWK